MGRTGRLTYEKVRIGASGKLPQGRPERRGTTKYTYFQIFDGDVLIDCVRRLYFARTVYGHPITNRATVAKSSQQGGENGD